MSGDEDREILLTSPRHQHQQDNSQNNGPHMVSMEMDAGAVKTDGANETTPINPSPMSGFVFLASTMAALGGVLFGYDVGIVSGALLQLQETFHLSCFQREMVVSSMLIGALIGSLCGGFLVDQYGRRFAIIVNAVIFVLGAITLGFSHSYALLLFGRVLVGFAVSLSAIAECIYISEIAPAKRRGLLVSLNELGITIGLLLAYLVNFLFIRMDNGWRYMFALSALPAICQGVGMFFLPRSPRYLMIKKNEPDARQVLERLRSRTDIDQELTNIRLSVSTEHDHTVCDLFKSLDNMRGRMIIGAGLVFFQQITGQPNVLYYAPTIFQSIGFAGNDVATLHTVGLGTVKVISTIISLLCVDRAGRRKFLLLGAILMMLSITILGVTMATMSGISSPKTCEDMFVKNYSGSHVVNTTTLATINANSERTTPVFDTELVNDLLHDVSNESSLLTASGNSALSWTVDVSRYIALAALMVFVSAYAIGFGPVTWLVLSEIFPVGIRGRAIAMATILNWGTNLIVSMTFLDVMNAVGVSWTFIGYGIICLVSVAFIFVFVPETKNKTLEKISKDLTNSSLTQRLLERCPCLKCLQQGSSLRLRLSRNYEQVDENVGSNVPT